MVQQVNLFGETQEIPGVKKYREFRPVPGEKIKIARFRGPLMPLATGEMSKLEQAFWKFHYANPQVYRLLVKFARQWRYARGGHARMGIGQLFERVRWEISLNTVGDQFKLNNNHRAFYARLIMDRNEDLEGIFRLRKQRIPATIGPTNKELPSGKHIA